MRGCAKSSHGISIPRPAVPSGSITPRSSDGIRASGSQSFDDLRQFDLFEDEWLRGGPVQRWVPRGMAGKPVFVFETGGTTGIPKTRINCEDFRIDYEIFSTTLPDEHFPKGANWLMLGPSGPRRLRLAVEHLTQHRGGICVLRRSRSALGDQADQEGLDASTSRPTRTTSSIRP